MKLEPLIVSAPFGNWLNFPGCTSTLGTFTNAYRGGLLYRIWRCILTLRHHPATKDHEAYWTNKLKLPNPGVKSVRNAYLGDKIVSVHGFSEYDWFHVVESLSDNHSVRAVELNLSCPNVGHTPKVEELERALVFLAWMKESRGWEIIAKLPPVRWAGYLRPLLDHGVHTFHCCNTLPCPEGGRSGPPQKPYAIRVIKELRDLHGDSLKIIGGSGVGSPADVRDYKDAGADHVAVGSFLLNPFNWRKIPALLRAAKETRDEREEVRAREAERRRLSELREASAQGGLHHLLDLLTGEGRDPERPSGATPGEGTVPRLRTQKVGREVGL